jgi:hypothetical protein
MTSILKLIYYQYDSFSFLYFNLLEKTEGREKKDFLVNLSFGNLLTTGIILRNYHFIKSSVAKIIQFTP